MPILYESTRSELGVYIDTASSRVLHYTDVVGNPTAFSFLCRIYPQFNASDASATDKYLFKYYSNSENTDYIVVYYDESDSDWVFYWHPSAGTNITLRTSDQQRFQTDNYLEIAGWVDSDGRSINSTTYYGKLFVNGIEVDSSTTNPADLVNYPDRLYIGSNAGSEYADCIFDEVVLFNKALMDHEIVCLYYQQLPLSNLNTSLDINYSLSADDNLIYRENGDTIIFDNTLDRVINIDNTGRNLFVDGRQSEETWLYTKNAITELNVVHQPHWY